MTRHHFLQTFAFGATISFVAVAVAPVHAQEQSENHSIRFINPSTLASAPRIASKLVEIPPEAG